MSRTLRLLTFVALLAAPALAARADLEDRITDQFRLGIGAPEWASLTYQHRFHHGGQLFREPFFEAEAGFGAGKLALGSGYLESTPDGEHCVGHGLKLAFLRTWNEALFGDTEESFVGIEGERFFKCLGHTALKFGLYYQVSGHEDDRDILVSAGLSIPIFSTPRGPSFFGH